jgi:hypothetical protein
LSLKETTTIVSGNFNPIEALSLVAFIDFQVDGARHLFKVLTRTSKKFLAIIIFLYLPYSLLLCSLDGVVKP